MSPSCPLPFLVFSISSVTSVDIRGPVMSTVDYASPPTASCPACSPQPALAPDLFFSFSLIIIPAHSMLGVTHAEQAPMKPHLTLPGRRLLFICNERTASKGRNLPKVIQLQPPKV